jgi:hypothetical protein
MARPSRRGSSGVGCHRKCAWVSLRRDRDTLDLDESLQLANECFGPALAPGWERG